MVKKHPLDNKKSHIKKIIERKNKETDSGAENHGNQDSQDEILSLKKLNEELEAKNKKLYNDLLMSAADKENIKKMMEREVQNAKNYAVSKLAEKIVASLDSLEKAISSSSSLTLDENMTNIMQGVDMTFKSILSALKDDGVEQILPAVGDKFDHNFHQAVQTVNDDTSDNNTIKNVLRCGYKIKSRLLRAAMVVVSKKNV